MTEREAAVHRVSSLTSGSGSGNTASTRSSVTAKPSTAMQSSSSNHSIPSRLSIDSNRWVFFAFITIACHVHAEMALLTQMYYSSPRDDGQVSPTSATRGALSPSLKSSVSDRRMSDLANYRRDLAVLDSSRGNRDREGSSSTTNQIAPWMSPSSSAPANSFPTSFYNDSNDSLPVASHPSLSPALPQSGSRTGQLSASFDSPDGLYRDFDYHDARRPSAASVATTVSSQGSKASAQRGGFRKLQGFFGEEFPGRDSSESSLPASLPGKDQRSHSYSHARPSQRDRNYSNATDREASPASSRPRTPVPAPEVVPFLYQDNTVRLS